MDELKTLEYRVREKKTFFVTRYCDYAGGGSITEEGEFHDILAAQRAASALCHHEASSMGLNLDDPRIVWPEKLAFGEPASN